MTAWPLILMLSCGSADLATTELALSRGAHEANPIMQRQDVRITINVAAPVLIWLGLKSKPKTLKKVAIFYSAIHCAAAGWNTYQLSNLQ